ncbi:MAG: 50S ribosomal protein L11 methyltransferase [Cytophagales bacterium]|nr:50S ribosomal protein L11 methyltransferase [Cytophagales bacterium]
MTQYLKIFIECPTEIHDLLIAELGLVDYDSFQEFDNGIEAFIDKQFFNKEELFIILEKYGLNQLIIPKKLENINWNEQWEKNFKPVYIRDEVQVRATFHEKRKDFKHDIIINPKMSFGTGHHETTHLVISQQLSIDHKNKKVLDIGTGTGVLAIMACKLGAKSIYATDVDDWCIMNCKENFELNKVENLKILQGTVDELTLPGNFDIILANINKNVLLHEMQFYAGLLASDGKLVLSGFYIKDLNDLKESAFAYNMNLEHTETRNDWAMMRLTLSNT